MANFDADQQRMEAIHDWWLDASELEEESGCNQFVERGKQDTEFLLSRITLLTIIGRTLIDDLYDEKDHDDPGFRHLLEIFGGALDADDEAQP